MKYIVKNHSDRILLARLCRSEWFKDVTELFKYTSDWLNDITELFKYTSGWFKDISELLIYVKMI